MRSISGIDEGQRVTAAYAIDDGQQHRQGFVKRAELYANSRMKQNMRWLRDRKERNSFDVGEVEQSIKPRATASVAEYYDYIMSRHAVIGALYWFYGQRAILRKLADSAIGLRTSIDKSIEEFLQVAGGGMVVVGDGGFGTGRRGNLASLHRRWLKSLGGQIKAKMKQLDKRGVWMGLPEQGQELLMDPPDQRQELVVPKGAFWLFWAREHNTSQRCPRCWGKLKIYHRERSPDGTPAADILRLKKCLACKRYFHRDGLAASAIVTIAADALLRQHRPFVLCSSKWTEIPA